MTILVKVIIVTIFLVSVASGGHGGEVLSEAGVSEEPRSIRKEIRDDQWRAVEDVQIDTSGWIPDFNSPQQESRPNLQPPKRRRLRKRKRRPQVVSITEEGESIEHRYPMRRIKRPQHLHDGQDLWTQMEEDAKVRPNKRRRIIPLYHDNFGEKHVEYTVDDRISVIQADGSDSNVKTTAVTLPDLKSVLKQAGGLSLSEILQQKNLSLTNLLKGDKEAILAITEKPNNATEKPNNPVIVEYKNPVEEDLPVLPKYNRHYKYKTSTIKPEPEFENIINKTFATTESVIVEKKIYEESTSRVYTRPNNVIVVDFKPNVIGLDLAPKVIDLSTTPSTTTRLPRIEIKPKNTRNKHLPITSAKLNNILKLSTTPKNEASSTELPQKAYKINVNELFGISSVAKEKVEEGPLRMSLDLNKILDPKLSTTRKPIEATTLEFLPEKLKTITAKDEILEVLKDEEIKSYLDNILGTRNMTIDDLVELRERGSSQKHLADLFHNRTKQETTRKPATSTIKTNISLNRNHKFDRQPKTHILTPLELKDSDGDRYVASIEVVEDSSESKSIEESKDKDKYTVTSFPTYKIELDKKFKDKTMTPVVSTWANPFSDLYDDYYQRTHQKGIVEDLNEKYFDDLRALDELENTISETGSEKLNVEASKEVYEDTDDYNFFVKLPYGVKHAIFASLLIIGISLVIFLTILMIFKWSQKHKKKLCYNGSFSCSKIKSPILQNSEKRSFRTFVSETLGRKKHYYKRQLQSMSDAIWENDRKPFQ